MKLFWVRGWEDYCWVGGNCFLNMKLDDKNFQEG